MRRANLLQFNFFYCLDICVIWEDIKVVNYRLLKVKLWTSSTCQCVPVCSKKQERVQRSRRVHRHPYCWVLWEKCRFFNLAPKGPWTQIWAPGSESPRITQSVISLNHWLLGFRWVHRHPYCWVLWEKCNFFKFGTKGPLGKNLAPGSKSP